MRLCDPNDCTGCMACANICPKKCIAFQEDKEGFLRPHIDETACVHCGLCAKKCPQNNAVELNEEGIAYGCWHKDPDVRKRSTSGGAFTAIASYIFAHGGVVYGAGFDCDLTVCHKRIDKIEDIDQLRGSKYVQSMIGTTYTEAKNDLECDKLVLFSGTPCQIAGLKYFLGKEYDNLLTVDIVCHGVPSPKIYKDYLSNMENLYQSKISQIYFRDKTPGWFVFGMKIEFENQKVYKKNKYADPYLSGFLKDYFIRPNCHSCRYTTTQRVSDITLADFWCFKSKSAKLRDTDEGISLCLVNSPKGEQAFKEFSSKLIYVEDDIKYAASCNVPLMRCFKPNEKRSEFWEEYDCTGFSGVLEKYMAGEEIPKWAKKQYMLKKIPTPIWVILKAITKK